MKTLITISLPLLCASIAYGQIDLQHVMDHGNRTTNMYTHYSTVPQQYIMADTAYKFSTDYYTPIFATFVNGDSTANLLSPTGSPSPANLEADHVFDQGINLGYNSNINPAHGAIGIQMESLYWGGLSATVPAQELHLFQNYKNNTGAQRFLTYAGLEDGSKSELSLYATKINLGDPTMLINLCSQGADLGGMSVAGNSIHCYTGLTSTSSALFSKYVIVSGTNANGGGGLTVTSGATTNNGQAAVTVLSNGTNTPAIINVNGTGTNDAAKIIVASTAAAGSLSITGTAATGDFISANGLHKVEIGASTTLSYLSAPVGSLNLFTSAAQPVKIGSGNNVTDLVISASHNVLIANTDSVGGNLSVAGNTYAHTSSSSSSSDSLLGKNLLGQMVSVAPIAVFQARNDSAIANVRDTLQQQITANNSATVTAIDTLQQQITANDSATVTAIDTLQQLITANNSATVTAIDTLQQQITTNNSATVTAIDTLQQQITTNNSATVTAIDTLQQQITTNNSATVTAIDTLQQQITTNNSATVTAIDTLQQQITTNNSATANSIDTLQQQITTNNSATVTAIDTLQQQITTNNSATANSIDTLQQQITANNSTTVTAIDTLQQLITANNSATVIAIDTLQQQITANNSTTVTAIDTLQQQITTNNNATTNAIDTLQQLIADNSNATTNGMNITLQKTMDNNNRTTDVYTHYSTTPLQYITADTAYRFSTDYYTPIFTTFEAGDSTANLLSPTGSPSPANLEADHVFDQGINLGYNSNVNPAHGAIGIQMESLYWGGLSSTVPAQELHLFQNYKNNTGSQRFLTYAGLEDGSKSELSLYATKINLGDPTMLINLCSQGADLGGMSVAGNSIHCYTGLTSTSSALFSKYIIVSGTNANGGGGLTVTSGATTNNGQAAVTVLSNGTNTPAIINVNGTGTNDAAKIIVASTAAAGSLFITGTAATGDFISANGLHKVEIGASTTLSYLSAPVGSLNLFTSAAQPVNISSGNNVTDLVISASHNVLIANTDSVGGNLSVAGNTYAHTSSSSSSSDSLLGKNLLGQMVSVAPIAVFQARNDSAIANVRDTLQQQITTNNNATANAIDTLQQQITANDSAMANRIDTLQQQIADNSNTPTNGNITLQKTMDNNNRTTDVYTHYSTTPLQYITADTAYRFATDYYHPVFTTFEAGDSLINLLTPTGSPSPANLEADHVFDQGINLGYNSNIDPAHGAIGIQMESLYWGGLSATIPAQELHLFQNYKNNTGSQRFLTYAGLEDGSKSELSLYATKINLGDPTMLINLCSQGADLGGMSIAGNSIHCYTGLTSTSSALFSKYVIVSGTNDNGGGGLTVTSGATTNNGQAAVTVLSNGTNTPAIINVNGTGTNDAAKINVTSSTTTSNLSITGSSATGDFISTDGSHKIEIGASSNLAYLSAPASLNLFTSAAQPVNISSGSNSTDLVVSASHNVLIANTDSIGGDLLVAGNTYIHTAPSSSISSDSLLGKDASGQIVSIGSITELQATLDSARANAIAILQQQVTELQSEVKQLQAAYNINCGATTKSHLIDNVPNPFSNTTQIRYYLADDTSNAYIIVTTISGAIIKEYNIIGNFTGNVIFDAASYPDAIYMYSLMINGQIVDTKKMVLVR